MFLRGLIRAVAEVTDALVNRRDRLGAKAFLEGLRNDVARAFATSTDPVTGTPWAPRARPSPRRLLIKTGVLINSALQAADSARPSGWGVTVTLGQPAYAGFHQHGTRKMPARRFWGVSPATVAATRKHTTSEIVKLTVKT